MEWGVQESPTARCINCRLLLIAQSRSQKGVDARRGSVGAAVAARERNRGATAGAPAMETVVMND